MTAALTNAAARPGLRSRVSGATLVVGLLLLLVLTVVGVSGMGTATTEVAMAGNAAFEADAFEAAEDGIATVLAQRLYTTREPTVVDWLGDAAHDRRSVATFVGTTPVPDAAFSMGTATGSFQAFHFDVASTGRAARNARALHTQSFYVIGPGGE